MVKKYIKLPVVGSFIRLFPALVCKGGVSSLVLFPYLFIPFYYDVASLGEFGFVLSLALAFSAILRFGGDSYLLSVYDEMAWSEVSNKIFFSLFVLTAFMLASITAILNILFIDSVTILLGLLIGFIMSVSFLAATFMKLWKKPVIAIFVESGLIYLVLSLVIFIFHLYFPVEFKVDLIFGSSFLGMLFLLFLIAVRHQLITFSLRTLIELFSMIDKVKILYLVCYAVLIGSLSWLPVMLSYVRFGAESSGGFAFAFRLSLTVAMFQSVISTFYLPRYVESVRDKNYGDLVSLIRSNAFLGITLGVLVLMVFWLFGEQLIEVVNPSLDGAFPILIVLLLVQIISMLLPSDGYILMTLGLIRPLLWINVAALFVFLIPAFLSHTLWQFSFTIMAYVLTQKLLSWLAIYKAIQDWEPV